MPPSRSLSLLTLLLLSLLPAVRGAASGADGRDGRDGIEGQIVDAQTLEPIVGAWIFETLAGSRRGADVPRYDNVRVTRSDARGTFRFERPARSFLERLFRRPKAPRYHAYHESYGLVRGRPADEEGLRFALSLRDSHLRSADAAAICAGRSDDAMHATLRRVACPPARPDHFGEGRPRAEGARDAAGRREGRWTFFREDGSIRAVGHYRAGGAVDPWQFFPP